MKILIEITYDDDSWRQEGFTDIERAIYFLEEVYEECQKKTYTVSQNNKCTACGGRGKILNIKTWLSTYRSFYECPTCKDTIRGL